MQYKLLIALFICAVYGASQQDPPTPVPIASQIRIQNGLQTVNISLTVYDGDIPRTSSGVYSGFLQYIYSGEQSYYYEVALSGSNITLFSGYFLLVPGKAYTYAVTSLSNGVLLEDVPATFLVTASYIRVVNSLQGDSSQLVEINAQGVSEVVELSNGEITDFFETRTGEFSVHVIGFNNFTSWSINTTTATVYLIGDANANGTTYWSEVRSLLYQIPDTPSCNGYIESTGVCNCFSGHYTDSYLMQCYITSPQSCYNNVTTVTDLDNEVVPFVNWGESEVHGDRLNMTIYSDMVAFRRTLIEMPNPQCNFINSPQYYRKGVSGCLDQYGIDIPFIECGFVKTSTPQEDIYRGTILVKQIDHISIGQWYQPRVIDTPFPVAIRVPKTLAIYSDLQVIGPPSLELDAAFVGQTVNIADQSGDLLYMSLVQYPLVIENVEAIDLPAGVSAVIDIVNINCSMVAPCLQRLDVHLTTSTCFLSGVYRLAITLGCRDESGCPEEARNGAEVYLESRIVSRSLCSEVSVDIDLGGYIQTFTDSNFSNEVLVLYPGQSAYFVVNAYSPRVTLSSITLNSVYYYGPNIGYQYLLIENNMSSLAASNNFAWGALDATRAWFSVDVSVSTPDSSEETLFKLNQGQSAWHSFVAIVDIEWIEFNGPTSAPQGPVGANEPMTQNTPSDPPTSVKKRMALQGPVSNQGSQFSAIVQVAGPTQEPGTSVSSAVPSSCAFAAIMLAVVCISTYLSVSVSDLLL